MQDDEPSLQQVRMTRATFQEICRKHSTELQRQCRGSTVIEKLSYLFKRSKKSSYLLLTRSARAGCLWGHWDESKGRSLLWVTRPVHCCSRCIDVMAGCSGNVSTLRPLGIPISFSLMRKAQCVVDNSVSIYKGVCSHLQKFRLWRCCLEPSTMQAALMPSAACEPVLSLIPAPWVRVTGWSDCALDQRCSGTPADVPNLVWQCTPCTLSLSALFQPGFSLNTEVVTNRWAFTRSNFLKCSSPVVAGHGSHLAHCNWGLRDKAAISPMWVAIAWFGHYRVDARWLGKPPSA